MEIMETIKIKTVLLIIDLSVYYGIEDVAVWYQMKVVISWWGTMSMSMGDLIKSDDLGNSRKRLYLVLLFWLYNLWMFCFIFLTLLKFESFARYNYRENCWCLGILDLWIRNMIEFSLNWCAIRWSVVYNELLGESFNGRRSRELSRSGPMTVLSVVTWSISLLWFA